MTETVTLALSELRSLITKAARGAGLSWGLAEEAGWAAEWLARHGMPAADWATIWLAARIDGATSSVEVGVQLADELVNGVALEGRALPDGLSTPGYLLPFLHRIARERASVTITSTSGHVVSVSSEGQVAFGPFWAPQSCCWTLSKGSSSPPKYGTATRPSVSRSVLECLDGLALLTTVPQSTSSRLDAGSSTGDND